MTPPIPQRECEMCNRAPDFAAAHIDAIDDAPVLTRNRAVVEVGGRLYIEPVCDHHDTTSVAAMLERVMDYGGVRMVARCVQEGVCSPAAVRDNLPDDIASAALADGVA